MAHITLSPADPGGLPRRGRALLDALERHRTARGRGEDDSAELLTRLGLIHEDQ